jgi:hypothetical protein
MKKIKIALVCVLALQLAALGIAAFLFAPKCAHDIRLGSDGVLFTQGGDDRVHELLDDANRLAMQFQTMNPGGPLPTTPEEVKQSAHVDYIPQLVENSRGRVVIRVFGRNLARQEVSSMVLESDLAAR